MKRKVVAVVLLTCLLMTACGSKEQKVTEEITNEETAKEAVNEEANAEAETTETENEEVEKEEATQEEAAQEEVAPEAVAREEAAPEVVTQEETAPETVEQEEAVQEDSKEVTETVVVFEQPKVMYATNAVNVRRGPSTEYEVISHIAMAQQIETTGQADTGWYQVMIDESPAYISNKYLSETKVEIPPAPVAEQSQETQPAAQQAQVAPPVAQQVQTAQPAEQAVTPAGIIMVGDSRCVQMKEAIGENGCMWVCENSKEYTWFSEKAIPKFDKYVGKGTKVVINMGVNDPEHYRQYVGTINTKAAEWAQRGATTYLVSVNPVWENPYTTKEEVDTFNTNVPGMLIGVNWIDTYTWLVENGYRLLDGLHYDAPTYVNIYNFIMGSL